MKTFKLMSAAILVLLIILAVGAATPPAPGDKKATAPASESLQCGVSNAEVIEYLQNCSHHHTVYWVQDIPGTCNSKAGIEFGKTATVYVENGIIVGHLDSSGYSEGANGSEGEGPK